MPVVSTGRTTQAQGYRLGLVEPVLVDFQAALHAGGIQPDFGKLYPDCAFFPEQRIRRYTLLTIDS